MVLPKYRRNKIEKRVAFQLFNMYKGKWEIEPISNSKRAYMFCEKIIRYYINDKYEFKKGIFIITNK